MEMIFDTVIIGAGPSGIGCALALQNEGKNILLIDKGAPGGKVNICPRVDNYPRQHEIPGPDLAFIFYTRMKDAKVPFKNEEVLSLTKENDVFITRTTKGVYTSKTVYCASGTLERKLGLAKEDELLGHGVSYCALCDGHFFKGQDILVCGGGNAALKEAIYLSHLANHVTLIHRRNQFRANDKVVDELRKQEKITILTPYIPLEIIGDDKVEGVKIQNVETKEEMVVSCEGFFPLVGQIPSSQYLNIEGVKDERGNILVNNKMMNENVPGLFAGGDALPREIKQIYLSEHDGMVAAKSIIEYLK